VDSDRGSFALGRFHHLTVEQLEFLETFIKARGNFKDVERELGISYPTVRSRLDAMIRALGFPSRRGRTVRPNAQGDPPRARGGALRLMMRAALGKRAVNMTFDPIDDQRRRDAEQRARDAEQRERDAPSASVTARRSGLIASASTSQRREERRARHEARHNSALGTHHGGIRRP